METPPVAAPAPKPARNNTWMIGIVGGLLALCVCVVLAAAGLFIADPFGWHLLERAQGRYDPLAYAVPADAIMYGSVDLLQLQSPNLQKAIAAFGDVPALEGEDTDAVKSLEENLQENWGLSLTEDILPWAGQYMGFTVHSLEMRDSSSVRDSKLVFLFEARDANAAKAFVPKFTAAVTEKDGIAFTEEVYQGVTLYVVEEDTEAPLNIAYSNGLVLLSNDVANLKATIDAQQTPTEQLANTPGFKTDLIDRSKQYVIYVYIPNAGFKRYLEENEDALPNAPSTLEGLKLMNNMSMIFSAVDEGLRLDLNVAYDESQLSAEQKAAIQIGTREATLKHLPANTLAYVVSENFNLLWEANLRNAEDPEALEESMAALEKQMGFNPATDLIPYLDGELGIAIVPDEAGLLNEAYGLQIGLLALAQTSQADELQATIEKFNAHVEDQGLEPTVEDLSGVEANVLGPGRGADPLVVYGLSDGWFGLATSTTTFATAYAGEESLADSEAHKALWANFPAGSVPTLYVDIQALAKLWSESEMAQPSFEENMLPYLLPMVSLTGGTTPLQNGVTHTTLILRLEKP